MGNKVEDIVDAQVEVSKNEGPERNISKGEERYIQIADSISNAKSRVSGWLSKGAAGLGRLFKTGAVGILNSPETISTGVKVAGEKIGEEAGYVKDSVVAGANFVGGKVVEGVKSVGEDFTQFDKYTSDKAEQLGVWVGEGMAKVGDTTSKSWESAKNYTSERVIKTGDCLKNAAVTTEAVLSLAKDKTKEGLATAKDCIKNNYDGAMKYGKDAIDTATLRVWYAKDALNAKMNAWKQSVLEKKAEIQSEKLQKTLAKLSQYKQVGQMSNLAAA